LTSLTLNSTLAGYFSNAESLRITNTLIGIKKYFKKALTDAVSLFRGKNSDIAGILHFGWWREPLKDIYKLVFKCRHLVAVDILLLLSTTQTLSIKSEFIKRGQFKNIASILSCFIKYLAC